MLQIEFWAWWIMKWSVSSKMSTDYFAILYGLLLFFSHTLNFIEPNSKFLGSSLSMSDGTFSTVTVSRCVQNSLGAAWCSHILLLWEQTQKKKDWGVIICTWVNEWVGEYNQRKSAISSCLPLLCGLNQLRSDTSQLCLIRTLWGGVSKNMRLPLVDYPILFKFEGHLNLVFTVVNSVKLDQLEMSIRAMVGCQRKYTDKNEKNNPSQ